MSGSTTPVCDGTKPCPKNFRCDAGTSTSGPIQKKRCDPGTFTADDTGKFKETGATSCVACPAGSLCDDSSVDPAKTPCPATFTCGAGTSTTGATKPTSCEPGSFTADDTEVFTETGATTCVACPAGSICTVSSVDPATTPCPASYTCGVGTTPLGGDTPPTLCKPGNFTADGTGTFEKTGATTCVACPAGFMCTVSSDDPKTTPCPAKYTCGRGTTPLGGTNEPTLCNEGRFTADSDGKSKKTGATSCAPCPAGSVCDDSSVDPATSLCPATKTCGVGTSTAGATKPTLCNPGNFTADGTGAFKETGAVSCVVCPAGSLCNISSINPATSIVLPGSFTDAGAASQTDVKTCPKGCVQLNGFVYCQRFLYDVYMLSRFHWYLLFTACNSHSLCM
jgi:hypothetical protein